jgi:formylglycine-generating enzyme required for sulfatase activity
VGRGKVTGRIAACAAVGVFSLLLAGCPLDLRSYVEWLKTRDTLIPIEEIPIASAGDSFGMGTSPTETTQVLTYSFLMSKYEITNAQFAKFIEDGGYTDAGYWTWNGWDWLTTNFPDPASRLPMRWTHVDFQNPEEPVVGISWYEAVAYCNWRSIRESLGKSYAANGRLDLAAAGYRLPTEVEWEYAAAKGEPGAIEWDFAYGPAADGGKCVCSDGLWVSPQVVGSKSAVGGDTRQGLCDMSGNVFEWCSDHSEAPMPATDRYAFYPAGDDPALAVIKRGGGYKSLYNYTVTYSDPSTPDVRGDDIGFRTVRRQ